VRSGSGTQHAHCICLGDGQGQNPAAVLTCAASVTQHTLPVHAAGLPWLQVQSYLQYVGEHSDFGSLCYMLHGSAQLIINATRHGWAD